MVKLEELVDFRQLFNNPDKDKRIIVFVDAEYVIQSLRTIKGKPKDIRIGIGNIFWNKIIDFVVNGRTLQEAIYYSSELDKTENPETYQRQKDYLAKIKRDTEKITIRLGKMQKVRVKAEKTWIENTNHQPEIPHTWVQKGVDVKITIDLIVKAVKNEYDTAVLIAGDSDFEEAIKESRSFNKNIELVTLDRYDCGVIESLSKSANKHKVINYEFGTGYLWSEFIPRKR